MIRPLIAADLPAVKTVINSSGLFPAEMMDDMTSAYLTGASSEQNWLVYEADGQVQGVTFYAPEEMTEGTYNLYLIAVLKTAQGQGVGTQLMHRAEAHLRELKQRLLIVETSGLDGFELTRRFYDKLGYTEEARIREFYSKGDDKVVFWKKL